jgi:FkbM family methyltransferase
MVSIACLQRSLLKRGEIHLFEPNPYVFEYTKENLSPDNNVYLNEAAVSDFGGTLNLYSRFSDGFSGTSTILNEVKDNNSHKKISVKSVTLDEYVLNNKPPTFLKIDVEGAENLVLKGGDNLLKHRDPIVAIEIWGDEVGYKLSLKTIKLLKDYGYKPYRLDKAGCTKSLTYNFFDRNLNLKNSENFVFKK